MSTSQPTFSKLAFPFVSLFIIITIVCFAFATQLDALKINHWVFFVANIILFFVAIITMLMHKMSVKNSNPRAFTNGVMTSMVIKLFVIGTAVLVYASKAGAGKSVYGVYAGMVLYLIYTALEVKIALQMNKKPNANN